MKSLNEFKTLMEEEKSDYSKFDMLVRAGLANKAQLQRIHRILDKMQEEKPVFNNADREILRNLFNRMADMISNNKQIFQQARRAVREELELDEGDIYTADIKISPETGRKVRAHRIRVEETDLEEALTLPNDPPMVLLLKRVAVRFYPNKSKVALYYNQKLDKHFTIPYGQGIEPGGMQAEEVELDEEVEEAYNPAKDTFNPQTHTAVTKDGVDKVVHKDKLASHKEQGWKVRHSLKAFHANRAKKVAEEVKPINEAIDTLRKIVRDKQHGVVKHKDGTRSKVDGYTASAIMSIHDNLTDENKRKLEDMVHGSHAGLSKVAGFAFGKVKK
jgi:hypothetical protein